MGAAAPSAAVTGLRQRPRRRAAALIAYFDTSAVVKLLVEEDGSELAEELWRRARDRVASRLVYPEARAALAAAERAGRIDGREQRVATADLDRACLTMTLVGVDADLARRAGGLAERHALRGYDAVHLATALSVEARDLLVITWDGELARAASSAGLAAAPRIAG